MLTGAHCLHSLEVMFVFGYRPKLADEMETRVVESIRQWKASQAAKQN